MADAAESGMASAADPEHPQPTFSESSLFKDPYASLDEIAGKPSPPSSTRPLGFGHNDPIASDGTMDQDAFRDPFQPIARAPAGDFVGRGKSEPPAFDRPEKAEKATANAPAAAPDPASPPAPTPAKPVAAPAPTPPAGQSAPVGPSQTPTPAGDAGRSAPTKAGVVQPSLTASAEEAKTPPAPQTNSQNNEIAQLRADLLREIGGAGAAQPGPGLEVEMTDEGLLISLTDQFDFSMFPVGSAEPQARVVHIMEKVAEALKNRPGAVIVRGHTDARPYRSTTYDNWRLSSARAQMAYYMLVRGGLPEKRVERIEGYADRRLKLPNSPTAAENRRIEILLRKSKT
jgi:chemotaxis protein MotB